MLFEWNELQDKIETEHAELGLCFFFSDAGMEMEGGRERARGRGGTD